MSTASISVPSSTRCSGPSGTDWAVSRRRRRLLMARSDGRSAGGWFAGAPRPCDALRVAGGGTHDGVGDLVDRRLPSARDGSTRRRRCLAGPASGRCPRDAGSGRRCWRTGSRTPGAVGRPPADPPASTVRHVVVERGRQRRLRRELRHEPPGRLRVEHRAAAPDSHGPGPRSAAVTGRRGRRARPLEPRAVPVRKMMSSIPDSQRRHQPRLHAPRQHATRHRPTIGHRARCLERPRARPWLTAPAARTRSARCPGRGTRARGPSARRRSPSVDLEVHDGGLAVLQSRTGRAVRWRRTSDR